jgi:hypothetical protein
MIHMGAGAAPEPHRYVVQVVIELESSNTHVKGCHPVVVLDEALDGAYWAGQEHGNPHQHNWY